MTLDNLLAGDVITHESGNKYIYRGWVHGSDCYVISTLNGQDAFVVTKEKLNSEFLVKQSKCKECGSIKP
jgi:hypothetical protein